MGWVLMIWWMDELVKCQWNQIYESSCNGVVSSYDLSILVVKLLKGWISWSAYKFGMYLNLTVSKIHRSKGGFKGKSSLKVTVLSD